MIQKSKFTTQFYEMPAHSNKEILKMYSTTEIMDQARFVGFYTTNVISDEYLNKLRRRMKRLAKDIKTTFGE